MTFQIDLPEFETLEALIKSSFDEGTVNKVLFEESNTGGVGGGQASSALKAEVELKGGEKVDLFIKACRKDSVAEGYNKRFHTFDKEIFFYQQLWSKIFEKTSHVVGCVPKFYGAGKVNGEIFIVLEDFGKKGFTVVSKNKFFSDEQIKLAMKNIAQFHVMTIGSENLRDKFPVEMEDYFSSEKNEHLVKSFFLQMKDNLKLMKAVLKEKESGNEKLKDWTIPAEVTQALLDRVVNLSENMLKVLYYNRSYHKERPSANVVQHGDFHMWNVAYKGQEFRMFDYQAVTFGPYANDLHHFLSQTTTPKMRKAHLNEYLDTYSNAVEEACHKLKIEVPEYFTRQKVQEEYETTSPGGLLFPMNFLLYRFIKDQDMFKDVKKKDNSREIVEDLLQCVEDPQEIFGIHFDMVAEYNSMGTYDIVENIYSK